MAENPATILAIETSCDETAAAIVKDGRFVLSNAVYTQILLHREYGGVVPELASRNHVQKLTYVVEQALREANMQLSDMDAIAVTYGPGLVGALLTGVTYAKSLAYAAGKPLIPVNHMEGHIAGNYISHPELEPPFLCLVVSGGHTQLAVVEDYGEYRLLGETRDDAAGEALDKIARVLGLPYPGGPALAELAKDGNPNAYTFPVSFKGESHLDFSFSGIKTAVINLLHTIEQKGGTYRRDDIAASFQKAIVDNLVRNTVRAFERERIRNVAVAGGVSANTLLRETLTAKLGKRAKLYFPQLAYCTDNAAMIGAAAYDGWVRKNFADYSLNADPSLDLPEKE